MNIQLNDQLSVDEKSDDNKIIKNREKDRDVLFDQVSQHLLILLKEFVIFDQNFSDVDDAMQMFLKNRRVQLQARKNR